MVLGTLGLFVELFSKSPVSTNVLFFDNDVVYDNSSNTESDDLEVDDNSFVTTIDNGLVSSKLSPIVDKFITVEIKLLDDTVMD